MSTKAYFETRAKSVGNAKHKSNNKRYGCSEVVILVQVARARLSDGAEVLGVMDQWMVRMDGAPTNLLSIGGSGVSGTPCSDPLCT